MSWLELSVIRPAAPDKNHEATAKEADVMDDLERQTQETDNPRQSVEKLFNSDEQ